MVATLLPWLTYTHIIRSSDATVITVNGADSAIGSVMLVIFAAPILIALITGRINSSISSKGSLFPILCSVSGALVLVILSIQLLIVEVLGVRNAHIIGYSQLGHFQLENAMHTIHFGFFLLFAMASFVIVIPLLKPRPR